MHQPARSALLLLASVGLLSPVAQAQPFRIKKVPPEGGPVMAPARKLPTRTSPRMVLPAGGWTDNLTTQVNVNGAGQNIVGDAANEPSIAVDPTAPNRLSIGWRQFDSVTSNFRQGGRAYSNNGGRTWHNIGVFTPGQFRSDPVLETEPSGRFDYLDIGDPNTFAIDLFQSGNGGQSWTGPISAFAGDKEWFTIDKTSGPGRGFIYESWQTCCGAFNTTTFTRSTTGGLSWLNPIAIPGPPIFGTMAVGPAGELYIAGINPGTGEFIVDKSTNANNAGATPAFTMATVNIGGQFTLPGGGLDPNPVGLEGQVYVGVDRSGGPRNGWVYMVATAWTGGVDPEDIMFSRSTDGGTTWSAPIRINNDAQGPNNYQWFGTLSVAPNGRLDVIWNDSRDSQAYNLNALYYAFSNDGGTTWQGNTPLTPPYDTNLGWPQQSKIGDYYDMKSDNVGAFVAFAATLNNEQDVYFLRIGDWDCNGNGIPDATDLATGVLHDCNHNGIPDECEAAAGIPVVCPCYPNCDASTSPPILNVNDFSCFLNRFAAGDTYANCDNSIAPPVLNVNDFSCFLNRFAAGCS